MPYPSIEELAVLSFELFEKLPKTGKPKAEEWTVLSTIIQHDRATNESRVVALGAGTKCIGKSQRCPKGLIINDSHAEVLARRGFKRYLYEQLKKASNKDIQDERSFVWNKEKLCFSLKPGISFHFVSTQTPCGDACIEDEEEKETSDPPNKKLKLDSEDMGTTIVPNHIFTGARQLHQIGDTMQQTVGALRTKPGKGERTASMSCSDKMARWNVQGVQGALLDALLEQPIFLETLNFCCDSKKNNIKRALYKRFAYENFTNSRFQVHKPEIRIEQELGLEFEFSKQVERPHPSPNGLVWYADETIDFKSYQVSVAGRKQGVVKKKWGTRAATLDISRCRLGEAFVELLSEREEFQQRLGVEERDLKKLNYGEAKKLAKEYQSCWGWLKENFFKVWEEDSETYKMFILDNDKRSEPI